MGPRVTVVERKNLLRNVLELDEDDLSDSELALVELRLAAYQANHSKAVPSNQMVERVRAPRDLFSIRAHSLHSRLKLLHFFSGEFWALTEQRPPVLPRAGVSNSALGQC